MGIQKLFETGGVVIWLLVALIIERVRFWAKINIGRVLGLITSFACLNLGEVCWNHWRQLNLW